MQPTGVPSADTVAAERNNVYFIVDDNERREILAEDDLQIPTHPADLFGAEIHVVDFRLLHRGPCHGTVAETHRWSQHHDISTEAHQYLRKKD